MKKLSTWAPILKEAEARTLSELQKDWKDYFSAKMNKFGVKSPAELSEEDKKNFFNELKKDWERGKGATDAGKKDVEEHGVKESEQITEAEIKNDAEFKEYAETVLKKAFGDKFDQKKADETVDGILKKADGDYGAAVGMLTSGLG